MSTSENGLKRFYTNHFKGFFKKRRTAEYQAEIDRVKGELITDLKYQFSRKGIRQQFTWKNIINPGWKQWMMRIAIFLIVRGRYLLNKFHQQVANERGDVPGWVLVVLMTTGLVTAIWTLAAPRIQSILRNSLDSMNNIR